MTIQFLPTEEQAMMRDGARRLVDQTYKPESDPDELWTQFAELGWQMVAVPEEHGGLGGDVRDTAVIAEELGRGLVRLPFVEIAGTAARLLLALAPERLEDLAMGATRPLFVHDEPAARGDSAWVETRAERDGDTWKLTGRKTGIVGASFADSFLVSARVSADEIGIFEVPADSAPLVPFMTIDDRDGGELRLDGTAAGRLGEGDASGAIADAVDHALVLESVEMLGSMQAVVDMTKEYLLTRKQYGQTISRFQALQHRLADMFTETEQTRSLVLRGLDALVAGEATERQRIALAVRAYTARAGHFVCAQGIQLHGGIGVTAEYPVGHHFKRLTAFATRHGTSAALVGRYAELVA